MHEILHAAGFDHEHQRADRDNYVTILWENVEPSHREWLERIDEQRTAQSPYDHQSIMHYQSTAFSRNGRPTIVSRVPGVAVRGVEGLSPTDLQSINRIHSLTYVNPYWTVDGIPKTKAALAAGLKPIVCVGESLTEREGGQAETVVKGQLVKGLDGLTVADMERIIIAYEPVWAIGTGKTATPEQAQERHAHIRRTVAEMHGNEIADNTRILYGGSVKPDNIATLMSQTDVDGAMVGGAALEAASFAQIVNYERK